MSDHNYETDFLVIGSGAAGMNAAITAHKNGLDVIIAESQKFWGGTTAISGGGLWLPNNPLEQKAGVEDSPEATFDYMSETIGTPGTWASDERKWAFINAVPHFYNMLAEEGVKWMHSKVYPDYYPDLKGGRIGRSVEVKAFNYKKLGDYRKLVTQGGIPFAIYTDDVWELGRAFASWGGFWRGARVVFRLLGKAITGQDARGMGYAYAGSLMYIIRKREIPVWLNSPMTDLIVEKGRVVGAVINKEGKTVKVKARRGVMLAAGGFAHNPEQRMKFQGIPGWSASPKGQNGDGIWIGQKIGGGVAMMEDAWWGAVIIDPKDAEHGLFILWERSFPYSMIVDRQGQRFANESESYVDIGHHILNHYKDEKDPLKKFGWLVTDKRHSRYINTALLTGKKPFLANGTLVEAKTLPELAEKMGVDKETFLDQIKTFNQYAEDGVDRDFERGRTAYDRYYSDPSVRPNPNLGKIAKGPFRAIKVYAGDLNTKGGLITDEYSRVLKKGGEVIEGLYAAGNNTASVMGHTYPGAGSTIAPASIFAYLGALHAARFDTSGPADFAGRK